MDTRASSIDDHEAAARARKDALELYEEECPESPLGKPPGAPRTGKARDLAHGCSHSTSHTAAGNLPRLLAFIGDKYDAAKGGYKWKGRGGKEDPDGSALDPFSRSAWEMLRPRRKALPEGPLALRKTGPSDGLPVDVTLDSYFYVDAQRKYFKPVLPKIGNGSPHSIGRLAAEKAIQKAAAEAGRKSASQPKKVMLWALSAAGHEEKVMEGIGAAVKSKLPSTPTRLLGTTRWVATRRWLSRTRQRSPLLRRAASRRLTRAVPAAADESASRSTTCRLA